MQATDEQIERARKLSKCQVLLPDRREALAAVLGELTELRAENERLMPLSLAVGVCSFQNVPESVYKAWKEPAAYRSDEICRLREEVASLERERNQALRENEQLKAELAAALTIAERIDRWEADLKAESERRIAAELELATLRNLRVEFSLIRTENKLLKEELASVKRHDESVSLAFNECMEHIDRVFQVEGGKPPPLLPDFLRLGESKPEGVYKLAKEYLRLKAELAPLRKLVEAKARAHCTICSGCLPDGETCQACGRIAGETALAKAIRKSGPAIPTPLQRY